MHLTLTLTAVGWVSWGVRGMLRSSPGVVRLAYWLAMLAILTSIR